MVTGMSIGAAGFALLAFSTNAWVFIAGIALFSIGEMTAHPKYYSFIGLVAPADRKAVYMGYAFLYGVFGSLLGSNLGAFMYARIVEPALHTPAIHGRSMLFFGLFAVLDVCAALGMVAFFRAFGTDTPETRRKAAGAMKLAYGLIVLLGGAFLAVGLTGEQVQVRTVIQSLIFLALGVGGILVLRKGAVPAGGA
jgi:hypothetical protein